MDDSGLDEDTKIDGDRWHHPAIERRRIRRAGDLHRETDDALLAMARQSHVPAFAELYRRHRADSLRYARRLTRRHLARDAAEDVVAEAVRKVLSALLHGSGPRTGFRPYLFTAIRTVTLTQAVSRHGSRDEHVRDEGGHEASAASAATMDAMSAFASLSKASRRVLWATEALDLSLSEAAALLGMTPSAVAMSAMRAREALRIAYVRQHLPVSTDATCQRALDVLARRSVGTPARTQSLFLDLHLTSCLACQRAEQQVRRDFGQRNMQPDVESA